MVQVNGVEMPLEEMSGVLVLETPSGHQSWALIVDATVEYGDAEFTGDEAPQMKVIATMKPGEMLRAASTEEVGEENVLVYSRLLVALLREERERYAELERKLRLADRERHEQARQLEAAEGDRDQMLRAAWRHGAGQGWFHGQPMQGKTLDEVLAECPHPESETDGCHICGGPDH